MASAATQARLGPYLLLKKLSEDPLGETFRAGQVSDKGIEQVLLLRVFNGSAIRNRELGERIKELVGLHEVLRSPNLAKGVDAGHYQGVPYVAYDYISGEDLATLMMLARRRHHPMPAQHALLVAERLASGLAVAFATRFRQQPVLHGFLVPPLVRLSSEGENRLMGFEIGNALRLTALDDALIEVYEAYLSPEARAGQDPSPADDVYSLGVILLELLAGTSDNEPAVRRASLEKIVAQGMPEIAGLIEKSISRIEDRITDVPSWQRAFQQIVGQGSSRSTPFHLAFYMHNVLREEIEREDEEIEHERSMELSKEELAEWLDPDAQPAPSQQVEVAAAPSEDITDQLEAVVLEEIAEPSSAVAAKVVSGARPRWPAAALILVALAAAAGGAYWNWFLREADGGADRVSEDTMGGGFEPSSRPSDPTSPAFATGEAGTDLEGGPSGEAAAPETSDAGEESSPEFASEALLARIDRIVTERTQSVESSLRREYDDQLRQLRDQLAGVEAARQEQQREAEAETERLRLLADAAEATAAEAPSEADQESSSRTTSDPLQSGALTQDSTSTAGGATTPTTANPFAAGSRPSPLAEPPAGEASTVDTTVDTEAAGDEEPGAELADGDPRSPRPAAPTPEITPSRPAPIRQVGPRLKRPPEPRYPAIARKLGREATVDVEVLVDKEGRVREAKSKTKVSFGFAEAAERAARGARFYPATRNGVPVEARTTIRISFKNQG